MKVLAIDTSSVVATCAVLDEEKLLGEYTLNQDMTHSERLIPMIKTLMDSLKLKPEDIDLFAGSVGPGSFTGLRIGLATIKGLAHVVDKSVIGISTLEALAFNVPFDGIVIPIMDARRDRVYTGIYRWENGKLLNIMEPTILNIDELLDIVDSKYEKVLFNGDGTLVFKDRIDEKLKDKALYAPISLNMAKASSIGELALLKWEEGSQENYFNLSPDYLRESQAQRQLNEKR
ncbi:tRNA (adenosine(37)-N6)-threonylcarbamoyltransferase complex dimerization subunit type 1 TsaB [Anaerosalibacter bizertensis]|uniref:tRNA (Adenosine(37)-N6)-threonylcarbamoyltransferase complex dimerization subunit type 1 TsaB n=1 Tax=Anaerosalibacter bizertensis TaxID=932217 RepID=A0A844FHB6_9FIRM|nr:tRNA (adenosine(37)-N6)-threonylcarbamoyltransferase complex dimerization subunit type 1 TsaB [Anaerosalibacter bizertensis]MBV1817372.1 tRNA (adenosine(37)-N6)-threonylcarbamoyltransferase complex dimerization subunit type 1 TsaB [Bacteroidales bacterium MSK.15.36]MBU5293002.1 tRNA (adenosine(37)-N6)-threonylcarbamoyltransferase complex dimerization subunit type 1 TsaB [Anaerosalibacter bizertensis]MCB5558380.1 tRNA (adenosine(37)-N6)-threonylcarbamoyltransferase complex dimerization subunit